MTAKKKGPTLPIRPHAFVPDFAEAPDWEGKRRCVGCHMPEGSRVHDYTPPKDNAGRIIGEGGDR